MNFSDIVKTIASVADKPFTVLSKINRKYAIMLDNLKGRDLYSSAMYKFEMGDRRCALILYRGDEDDENPIYDTEKVLVDDKYTLFIIVDFECLLMTSIEIQYEILNNLYTDLIDFLFVYSNNNSSDRLDLDNIEKTLIGAREIMPIVTLSELHNDIELEFILRTIGKEYYLETLENYDLESLLDYGLVIKVELPVYKI